MSQTINAVPQKSGGTGLKLLAICLQALTFYSLTLMLFMLMDRVAFLYGLGAALDNITLSVSGLASSLFSAPLLVADPALLQIVPAGVVAALMLTDLAFFIFHNKEQRLLPLDLRGPISLRNIVLSFLIPVSLAFASSLVAVFAASGSMLVYLGASNELLSYLLR